MSEPVHVDRYYQHIPIGQELIDDMAGMPSLVEMLEFAEAEQARFNALPVEEQRRELAELEAEQERARAERSCPHCGCDPQDHGSY